MVAVAPIQTLTKRGVGASIAAAAIDCSDYGSAVDAWLSVTGRAEFAGNKATEWGQRLEPAIRKAYVDKHQVNVYVPPASLFHPDLEFVRATPDGIVLDAAGAWAFLGPQCKSVGMRMAPLWDDGALPNDYLIQGVVEMAVTNLDRIDFYVLIGGQDDREVTLHREHDLEVEVLEALSHFWGYVERDEQPEITGSKKLRAHLAGLIKKKALVEATPADVELLERWREVAREMARLKSEEARIKNVILSELGKRGGNVLASPLGKIAVGAGATRTKWKEVAGDCLPALDAIAALDAQLVELTAIADAAGAQGLSARLTALRAGLALVGGGIDYTAVVARHTTIGTPSPRRPQNWTKNLDEETDDE